MSITNIHKESDKEENEKEENEEPYFSRLNTGALFEDFVFLSHNNLWRLLMWINVCTVYILETYLVFFDISLYYVKFWMIIRWLLDLFYLIDIISSVFHRMMYNVRIKKDEAPRSKLLIIVDLITCTPIDFFNNILGAKKSFSLIVTVAFLRCIRVYRIVIYLYESSSALGVNDSVILLHKYSIKIYLLVHTMACLWRYAAYQRSRNWISIINDIDVNLQEPLHLYLLSLYYIFYLFWGLGLGDLYPVNDLERMVSAPTMVLGQIIVVGFLVGSWSMGLEELSSRLYNFRYRMSLIKHEMNKRGIPDDLQTKVKNFYWFLWRRCSGVVNSTLFESLPRVMAREVNLDIYWNAIHSVYLLQDLEISQKRALASVMKLQDYMQGDVILKEGDEKASMMYLIEGIVQVYTPGDHCAAFNLSRGSCLGGAGATLVLGGPSCCTLRALTWCQFHVLPRSSLYRVAVDTPSIGHHIRNRFQAKLESLKTTLDEKKRTIVRKRRITSEEETSSGTSEDTGEHVDIEKFWDGDTKCWIPSMGPRSLSPESNVYKIVKVPNREPDPIFLSVGCPFVLQPNSVLLRAWSALVAVVVLIVSIVYPFYAGTRSKLPGWLSELPIFVDVIYAIDIILQLSTATLFPDGSRYATKSTDILAVRFSQFSFICDLIATIPTELFLKIVVLTEYDSYVNFAMLNRIIKIRMVFSKLQEMERSFTFNATVVRLFKYLLLLFLVSFWMGSCCYMIACSGKHCVQDSWMARIVYHDIMSNMSRKPFSYEFYVPLYSSCTLVALIGSGDIKAGNLIELIVMVFFFFVGGLLFCYLMSDYSATLNLIRSPRSQFEEMLLVMKKCLTYNYISSSLQSQIFTHLELQWENRKGYYILTNASLFHDLPDQLTYEMKSHDLIDLVEKEPLFQGLPDDVLNGICYLSHVRILPPRAVVVYAGETTRKMYIIQKGYCQVYSATTGEPQCVIGPGDSFHILEMMLGIKGANSVITVTHCVVVYISLFNFTNELNRYPHYRDDLSGLTGKISEEIKDKTEFNLERYITPQVYEETEISKSFMDYKSHIKADYTPYYLDHFRESKLLFLRFFLLPRTIMPNGTFIHVWERLRVVCALLCGLIFPCLIPLEIMMPHYYWLTTSLNVAAIVDIYVRLHVCYYDDRGLLISHPLYTARYYLSHGFVLDLLAVFPFSIFQPRYFVEPNGIERMNLPNEPLLYLNTILQLHRLPAALQFEQGSVFTYAKYVSLIVVFINVLACILVCGTIKVTREFYEGRYFYEFVGRNGSWITRYEKKFPFLKDDIMKLYFTAVYWIQTTASGLGLGDIVPHLEEELIYFTIIIFLGYLCFNYILVIVASYSMESHINLVQHQISLARLVKFMKDEYVPSETIAAVVDHFELQWLRNQGMTIGTLVRQLHVCLREYTLAEMYEATLRKVPLFSGVGKAFITRLSVLTSEEYHYRGATILQSNDVTDSMYVIHRGYVDIYGPDKSKFCTLGVGGIFGNLDKCDATRTIISAVATTEVTTLVIQTRDFHTLSKYHTSVSNRIDQLIVQNLSYAGDRVPHLPTAEGVKKIIIYRGSFWKSAYQFLILAAAYTSIVLVLYRVSFKNDSAIDLIVAYALDAFFIVNSLVDIHIRSKNDPGAQVHRCERWILWNDLVLIPIEHLSLLFPNGKQMSIVSVLRLFRLLRVMYIYIYFDVHAVRLNVNMVAIRIGSSLTQFTLIIHFFTCGWYLLACRFGECSPNSWYTAAEERNGFENPYLCSLYFSVTVFTSAGIGDISPVSFPEIIYCIIYMMTTMFAVGRFIGQMSMLVASRDAARSVYDRYLDDLQIYLWNCNTSEALIRKVVKYSMDLWPIEGGQQTPKLLNVLPTYLAYEVRAAAYGKHLYQSQIFSECHPDFVRQLLLHVDRNVFYSGNYVVMDGDIDGTMYFVHSGKIHVLKVLPHETVLHETLIEGDVFGVIEGVHSGRPHGYTYRAASHSVILSLNFKKWNYLFDYFPASKGIVYDTMNKIDPDRQNNVTSV